MKILLKSLIPAFVLLIGTSAFAQYRIATVDLGRVFTNYWKTKQAQVAIDDKKNESDKTLKQMADDFNKAKEQYQKTMDSVNDPAVSNEERDKRKNAAEDQLKDLKDQDERITEFERGAQASLQEQLKRTRDNIVADIQTVITAKAKADGYTLVIDTASQSANLTPVVLYAAPGNNDITDAVIKEVNVGAPVDVPKLDDKLLPSDTTKPKSK